MGPFAVFALILIGVYWVGRAIGLFDQLIGDGQSLKVFIEIMVLFLPRVVAIVLPVVSFAAALYVSNRLHSDSEMVVLQSSGLSPYRLMRPFLMFSFLVAVFAGVLSHLLVPISLVQLDRRQSELAEDMASRMIVGGRFLHPADGVTFFASKVEPDGSLTDIFMHDQRARNRDVTYTAHRAVLVRTDDDARLVMYEGLIQTFDQVNQTLSKIQFDEFLFDIGTLTGATTQRKTHIQTLTTPALLSPTAEIIKRTGSTDAELRMIGHQRVEQPLQSLVYPLIGMAVLLLGSFSRFGVTRQILMAVGIVIFLSTLGVMFRDMAWANISRWPLLYVPDLLGLAIAYIFLWAGTKSARRSPASSASNEVPA